MDTKELKDFIEIWLLGPNIQYSLKLPYITLNEYKKIFNSLGFDTNGHFDTNGWQHDFWWELKHSEYGTIQMKGSWWYGEYTLSKI